jgi:threonylcarbamoyladenosine tRNA methylthiotransferase MtaB
VVLTGCYAETSPCDASAVEGVSLVIGNKDKALLAEKVCDLIGHSEKDAPRIPVYEPISGMPGRTRALIKVQDGCDQFCAYCAVPLARSEMQSRPFAEVVAEAENLASRGYKEVVLTGIRLGRYENEGADLADLVRALTWVGGIERIRLSSIEVTDVPVSLLPLMSGNTKICRHLHVPLQSGDDGVLGRMNRPYTAQDFKAFVRNARSMVPGIAVTTDIIVGFPGETEAAFANTRQLTEEVGFSKAHVFRFSPRPGTAAARMADDVPSAVKDNRSTILMQVSKEGACRFAGSLAGQTVQVLAEGKVLPNGQRSGLTDTYVRVIFDAPLLAAGKFANVCIDGVSPDGVALEHVTV